MSHPFSASPDGPDQTSGAASDPPGPYPQSPSQQSGPSQDSYRPPDQHDPYPPAGSPPGPQPQTGGQQGTYPSAGPQPAPAQPGPQPGGYSQPYQQYPYGQPGGHDPQASRGYPPAAHYVPPPFLSPSDEKLWSTLSHLSIPFVGVIGPLVVYLLFKDRGPFVRANAVESLNFSIIYSIAQFVSILLTVVIIGSILLPIVGLAAVVLCILAALAAHRGDAYKYPVNYPFVH